MTGPRSADSFANIYLPLLDVSFSEKVAPFSSITSRSAVRQLMRRTCELLRDRGPVEILRFVL